MSQNLQKFFYCLVFISLVSILTIEAGYHTKIYNKNNHFDHGEGGSVYIKKYVPVVEKIYCGDYSPCSRSSGLNPNPLDCCSFYNCDKCRPALQKCGKGTHFNPKLLVCDWPHSAGCKAQNYDCHKYGYVKTKHIDVKWS